MVTIEAPAALRLVQAAAYDALGRPCWAAALPEGRMLVPVAGWAPGVYVLRLRTAAGAWLTHRLVVQP